MKQLRLFTPPKKNKARLLTLPIAYIDDNKLKKYTNEHNLDLTNLSSVEKYAVNKNVWDGYYLVSRFKGRMHVFSWYKLIMENKPFWYFLSQCSFDADNINSCLEPVWAKKLFEKIKNVCFRKRFFYNLFWIIVSNQPKLKQIINNFRRHQYAKRLFEKI